MFYESYTYYSGAGEGDAVFCLLLHHMWGVGLAKSRFVNITKVILRGTKCIDILISITVAKLLCFDLFCLIRCRHNMYDQCRCKCCCSIQSMAIVHGLRIQTINELHYSPPQAQT
jgi:hypothetical protein